MPLNLAVPVGEHEIKITPALVLTLLDEATKVTAEALKQRDAVIKRLEARVDELESRGNLKYCGVYKNGQMYYLGNFVTHGGSVWHCNGPTLDTPGQGSAWTLAVKQGAAGRDGRDRR